ncbi:ERF family protein [Corallococcus exercitus]|uniref:ERF family protein n=1 Tax=Corallococcus exercitus TaxID=2316736 RepID=A0A7Y4KEL6_9BACT|nr:ERF family protein [Corallococcus exercitus]NOK32380.1 ERF family protein [Corallococcus exercitus]
MTGTNTTMGTAEKAPERSLVRKLAEVMGEVERVPKSGRNDFHRYDYATEADIVSAVRKAMADRALMLIPSVVKTEWREVERNKGGKDRIATLTVRFTLTDGDSGEERSFEVLGEGQDQGDKATYKALTGAVKYALLKLFLIPTGDDPEDDGQGQGQQSQRGSQQRGRQASGDGPPPQITGTPPPRTAPRSGGADDVAAAIVSEAEQVTKEEFPALYGRAQGLPKGSKAREVAGEAVKAAAKRLGFSAKQVAAMQKPAGREPGAEG